MGLSKLLIQFCFMQRKEAVPTSAQMSNVHCRPNDMDSVLCHYSHMPSLFFFACVCVSDVCVHMGMGRPEVGVRSLTLVILHLISQSGFSHLNREFKPQLVLASPVLPKHWDHRWQWLPCSPGFYVDAKDPVLKCGRHFNSSIPSTAPALTLVQNCSMSCKGSHCTLQQDIILP